MTAVEGTTGVLAIWGSTFAIAEIGLERSGGFEVFTTTELAGFEDGRPLTSADISDGFGRAWLISGEEAAAPPATSPVFELSSAVERFGDGMVMTEVKLANRKRSKMD